MQLLICGDICPTASNVSFFENGKVDNIMDDNLSEVLKKADYRIANLECPLTECDKPIVKAGINLKASTKSVIGLQALGINFLTLSNNHILDYGSDGLESTINVLNNANISYAGAGRNIAEASKAFVFEQNNIRVGIYCCVEHEFTIAGDNAPGANPFEPLYSLDHIEELKKLCHYVIVLYHGLKEEYRYPTPKLQQTLRRLIEKGADLIVCQHSHCIGCEENYKNGKIIYGQGNFIFDNKDNEYWDSGMLLNITLNQTEMRVNKPVFFIKQDHVLRMATGIEEEKLSNDYYERSSHTGDETYIKNKYEEYAKTMLPMYLRAISGPYGNNWVARGINFLSGRRFNLFMARHYKNDHLLAVRNYIECECHNELLLQGVNSYLSEKLRMRGADKIRGHKNG